MTEISVVLPTHNRSAYLRQAVASVLAQRDAGFELIVVDDGSDDDTEAVLASIDEDPRVTIVRHDRPRGSSAARNSGIERARGAVVAFLDDDDLMAPHRLGAQRDAMGDAVFSWCSQLQVDATRAVVGALPAPTAATVERSLRDASLIGGASAVMARTDVLRDTGGFVAELHALHDWDLWLALAERGPGRAVPEFLVAYTVHPGNMFRADPRGQLEDFDRLAARRTLGPHAATELLGWLATEARLQGDRQTAAWALRERARRGGGPRDLLRAAIASRRDMAGVGEPPHFAAPDWLSAYGPVERG